MSKMSKMSSKVTHSDRSILSNIVVAAGWAEFLQNCFLGSSSKKKLAGQIITIITCVARSKSTENGSDCNSNDENSKTAHHISRKGRKEGRNEKKELSTVTSTLLKNLLFLSFSFSMSLFGNELVQVRSPVCEVGIPFKVLLVDFWLEVCNQERLSHLRRALQVHAVWSNNGRLTTELKLLLRGRVLGFKGKIRIRNEDVIFLGSKGKQILVMSSSSSSDIVKTAIN
jgi:hypothetical protein